MIVMRSNGPVVTSHKVPGMKAPGRDGDARGAGRGPASRHAAFVHTSLPHTGRAIPAMALARLQPHSKAATSAEELARLLSGVRTALGYSEIELAVRLGTTPRVVFALENGWLEALPPWQETRRIVDGWVATAGLDPRPALEALALAIQAVPAVTGRPADAVEAADRTTVASQGLVRQLRQPLPKPALAPVELGSHPAADAGAVPEPTPLPRRLWRLTRLRLPASRWVRLAAFAVVAAGLWTTTIETAVVAAAVAKLPAPAERAVRSISDFIAVRFAPLREGHRWISVDDPRSRRGDKLRIGRRSD